MPIAYKQQDSHSCTTRKVQRSIRQQSTVQTGQRRCTYVHEIFGILIESFAHLEKISKFAPAICDYRLTFLL